MLPRAHRISRGAEIVMTVRRGSRTVTPHAVVHRVATGADEVARFGVVVSKKVGGAVVRNLVRRRIQSICATELGSVPAGDLIVVRALPGSPEVKWDTLRSEIGDGLRQAVMAR
ncbi:MAG: ribonuclease P protein component [Microcella sp.]|nr:ribonuclease P protein component [Microcella sp.]